MQFNSPLNSSSPPSYQSISQPVSPRNSSSLPSYQSISQPASPRNSSSPPSYQSQAISQLVSPLNSSSPPSYQSISQLVYEHTPKYRFNVKRTTLVATILVVSVAIYVCVFRDGRSLQERCRDTAWDAWKFKQDQAAYSKELERREAEQKWEFELREREMQDKRRQAARETWQFERDQEAHRQQKEKEEYARSPMYWESPAREKCVRYATRQYTARLWDLPSQGYTWKDACQYMPGPVITNGKQLAAPDYCENHGSKGGIVGFWLKNFEEPECVPYWSDFTDDGCVGIGTRMKRYRASLQNLYAGDDWTSICNSTPAVINGIPYNNPNFCENKDHWHGMWGMWEVEDSAC